MKMIWKWILGIVIVLVVVAAIVGVVFLLRNNPNILAFRFGAMPFSQRFTRPALPNGQAVPNFPNNPNSPRGFGPGWYGHLRGGPLVPGMGMRGFGMFGPFGMGFFFLAGLLRLIVPLGVLALVAIIFYQLGKRAGASTMVPAAVPAAPTPDPQTPARGRKVAKSQ